LEFHVDSLVPADWPQVRGIYQEGIAGGNATFETEAPPWEQWNASHLPDCRLAARSSGLLLGWAALSPVSRRECYAGVAEVSVYVASHFRGQGLGKALLQALVADSERHGIWTLQGATFPENLASLSMQAACGFRMVGRRERIGRLNGVWRTTVLMERRSAVVGDEATIT
jgi:phosphinothricin acetyltransferase